MFTILLALSIPLLGADQTSQPNKDTAINQTVPAQPPTQKRPAPTRRQTKATDRTPASSSQNFVPTETIKADQAVAFPVDI